MMMPVVALLGLLFLAGCGSPEQRAQAYFERGKSLFEQGEVAKAKVELRNALQVKTDFVPAIRILFQIEDAAQNWDAAAGHARRVAELDPKDSGVRVRLGQFALASNALDDAVRYATAAAEISPQDPAVLILRASVLLRVKDNLGATQEAQKVLAIDPSNVDAVTILASEKLVRDDPAGALKLLDDLPPSKQDDFGVTLLRLKIYEKTKDLPQIEMSLQKLIKLRPNAQSFKNELLKFYVANRRFDAAETEMRRLADLNPDKIEAGMDLVRFLQRVKGNAAARQELVTRASRPGRSAAFKIALAGFDFQQGKVEESKQALQEIVAAKSSPEDVGAARVALTDLHLRRRDMAAAEAVIAEMLQVDNRSSTALYRRAAIRIERNQIDDAVADLRQALNDNPRSHELLQMLSVAYEKQGAFELADKQLADALRASNYLPTVGMNYVAFLNRRGLGAHAETVLTDLATRNPAHVGILSALANARLARQDWAGAHEIADVLRRIGATGVLSDQISGAAFGGQGMTEQSVAAYQSVLSANPQAAQPMFAVVNAYLGAKQADKAEAFLGAVLKSSPKNAEAYVLVGLTKLVKNEPAQALQSFKTAVEMQPTQAVGYNALSDFYWRQGNLDATLDTTRDGLKHQPKDFQLRFTRAQAFEVKGDAENAINEYEKLLADQPQSMIVINNLANLLVERRADKESRDRAFALAQNLTRSPVPQFKDTLAWILHLRGDTKSALPLLEEAAVANPRHPVILYHLGVVHSVLGDEGKATEYLTKALAVSSKDSDLSTKIRGAMQAKR